MLFNHRSVDFLARVIGLTFIFVSVFILGLSN